MAPKIGPTRNALDGSVQQECTKCHKWKDQQPHFYSMKGTRIVALCQQCRDEKKAYNGPVSKHPIFFYIADGYRPNALLTTLRPLHDTAARLLLLLLTIHTRGSVKVKNQLRRQLRTENVKLSSDHTDFLIALAACVLRLLQWTNSSIEILRHYLLEYTLSVLFAWF